MMKKIFNIPIVLSLAFVITLVSCDNDQVVSDPISPDGYPAATFTTDFSGTEVTEGDVITYTIKLDKWLDHDISFSAMVVGGTGDDHDIANVGGVIPAYSDSAILQIVFVQDLDADDAETLELEIGADYLGTQYSLNPSTVNATQNLTVANWIGPMDMTFDWSATVVISQLLWDANGVVSYGTVYDHENVGDYVDFDIYMAEADGYDMADPWATFTAYDYAATGDVPEVMTFMDTIPEGSYYLFCDLWANDLPGYDSIGYEVSHVDMPINMTFTRPGAFDISMAQPASQVINTSVPGYDDDNYDPTKVTVTTLCRVDFAAGVFTIYDLDDVAVVSGKASDFKLPSKRPATPWKY